MKSKILKRLLGAVIIIIGLWCFCVFPGCDNLDCIKKNSAEFFTFLGFILKLFVVILIVYAGYYLLFVEEPPAKKQPPAPQKEPIVQADQSLADLYKFLFACAEFGCYADLIPEFLQADFKAFMVGRTMQTHDFRSWVYPADMKLYANKLLYKGIDYPVQFKTD